MLKSWIGVSNKVRSIFFNQYSYYGLSTIFARGIEYGMLLILAAVLEKAQYGEFEFYKRTIELLAILVSFGTPTLLLSYTRSAESKINFTLMSGILAILICLSLLPLLFFFNVTQLFFPIVFYTLFFYSNSIFQSFNLVYYSSNYSAIYKIAGSILFNTLVVVITIKQKDGATALVWTSCICLTLFLIFYARQYFIYNRNSLLVGISRYFSLFKKLLLSSFTLVLNNFVNIAFLYTDIYIIKVMIESSSANEQIANYSFPLNVANVLLIVPLTFAQVDIEKVKKNTGEFKKLLRKNNFVVLILVPLLFLLYYIIVEFFYPSFLETIVLFVIILSAKICQSLNVPHGMFLVIKKEFGFNVRINLITFLFNLLTSVVLFSFLGTIGLALGSFLSLTFRYISMRTKVKKILLNR